MKNVMVIDDDPDIIKVMGLLIKSFGYQPVLFLSAEEALTALPEERPSIILLDLMMSPMDGLEFLERRRKYPDLMDIPVILFSGWDLSSDERMKYKGDYREILTKPVMPAILKAVIKKYCG
jgi:CheY-like chemotaxis protein